MAKVDRIFAFAVMGFIVLFALIHLGVSVGVIVPYRKYGTIFGPQIGLSAFNLVICLFGLITGILGIIATGLSSERFARVTCIISGVLGVFALGSLVAAIIINDKSINYVSSHFTNNLMAYPNSADARTKVDLIQNKYQCCGTDTWLDWTRAGLGGTSSMTNMTTNVTTTSTPTISSTSPANVQTTSSVSPVDVQITSSTSHASAQTTSTAAVGKRDVDHVSNRLHRRQASLNYGGIQGLPITFGVILPQSCCTSAANLTVNGSNSYCVSNNAGVANQFYTAGCAKKLDITAGNQATGFAIINSFMVVLAFVAIPVLLGSPAGID